MGTHEVREQKPLLPFGDDQSEQIQASVLTALHDPKGKMQRPEPSRV